MNESPAAQQQASSAPDDALPGFRRSAWVLIVAAVALHAAMIFRAEPLQSANDRSRWCTIWSLLNRRSYQIDEIRERPGWSTIDLVRVDGHFYSTKPPLMSTWVAGVTWAVCRLTGWSLDTDLARVNAVVLVLVNAIPFGLSLWLLARILAQLCRNPWTAWFLLLFAAFGTLLSPFLSTLNNHTVAAAAVMVATFCWLSGKTDRSRGWLFAAWGFSAAWAACHDLPAAAFTAWMTICAWRQSPRATWCWFLPGLLLPCLAFGVANSAATGNLIPAYAGYGGDSYRFVYEGVPSYWADPQGVDRNLDAPPWYLWHCLFGHHGWFSLTPVFLLVVFAAVSKPGFSESRASRSALNPLSDVPNREARHSEMPGFVLGTLVLSAIVLGFYLTRTGNYNYGGVSCALRWALFLVPLWLIALIPAIDYCAASRGLRGIAILALLASIYSAWEPTGHAWQQPWLFRSLEQAGWIDYRAAPPELPRPLHSWLAALPAAGEPPPWIEFQRVSPNAQDERLRVELLADDRVGQRLCAAVQITRRASETIVSQRRLLIDRVAFAAGKPPASCLVWPDRQTTPAQQQADLALFRGLPLLQAYRPGFVRYLKTALRADALPCQRVAAQVDFAPQADQPSQRYRSDVWLCDEVPFGVARVDWSVSDPATAAIVQQESWQVGNCHPKIAPTSAVTIDNLPQLKLETH
jgi:hypothetical protein